MLSGILAGLTTGALWGLSFVAPRAVLPYSAVDLTVARYGLFGIFCLATMVHRRPRPSDISLPDMLVGLLLGGAGYIGYFLCVSYAVLLAGPAIPPVIAGTAPVVLAIGANRGEDAIAWPRLTLPLALISLGILLTNATTLITARPGMQSDIVLGIGLSVAALLIWVIYASANAAILKKKDAPDNFQWTTLQGIGSAGGSLLLLPFTSLAGGGPLAGGFEAARFWSWGLFMAIAGSWLATWCWGVASKKLPLALTAQLIVSETVFGLLFGFLFEMRLPSFEECLGCSLQIVGVITSVAIFSNRRRAAMP